MWAAMHEAGHAVYEHNIDPRSSGRRSASAPRRRCTNRRAACSRTSSAGAIRSGGGRTSTSSGSSPSSSPASSSTTSSARSTRCSPRRSGSRPTRRPTACTSSFASSSSSTCSPATWTSPTLPQVWSERMHDYLGVEIADDARASSRTRTGAAASATSRPTRSATSSRCSSGRRAEDVPDLDDHLEQGDLGPLSTRCASGSGTLGRKFTPREALERAVGSGLDPEPYLRYLSAKDGAPPTLAA